MASSPRSARTSGCAVTTDLPTLALAAKGKSALRAVILGALGTSDVECRILEVMPEAHLLTVDEQRWRLEARRGDVFGYHPRALWRAHEGDPARAALSYVGKADLLVVTDVVGLDGALREVQPWLPAMRRSGYVWVYGAGAYADSLERTIVAAGKLLPGPAAADGAWIGKVPRA